MAEYHVGCGAFGIYAGTVSKRTKNMWIKKSECTDEAVSAVAQYLLQSDKCMMFDYKGKRYKLCVTEIEQKEGNKVDN